MGNYGEWEVIEPLGSGGQSEVYKVRAPARFSERAKCLQKMRDALDRADQPTLATAIWAYARPDLTIELGALKQFKIPPVGARLILPPGSEEYEAIERLKKRG